MKYKNINKLKNLYIYKLMNQKIFNNIVLLLIVLYIIKSVSPEKDSVLYVLQKYLNYFIYKIKSLIFNENFTNTFTGINNYKNKTLSFKSTHEIIYVNYFKKLYPNISEINIYRLYHFIKNLISVDIEYSFNTPSDIIANDFNETEILKLQTVILNKLNSGKEFSFRDITFEIKPKYYLNINGKELEPIIFNVKSNIGDIRIYIDINIRNDVYENKEYIVINDIKPITDKNIVYSDQNILYNFDIKPKKRRTHFTGDINMIFTNNSIDDYISEDIEIENIEKNISQQPVYNKSQKIINKKITNNINDELLPYNEYDNMDLLIDENNNLI